MSNTRTARPPRPAAKKPKVSLDLDTLEREVTHEPFVFRLNGEEYTITDPMETDWQDLVVISPQDAVLFLRTLLGEQYKAFAAHRMPSWKLFKLVRAIQEYYGMSGTGEEDASPTS